LAPKYEKLAQIFAGEPDVLIAKVDATEESALGDRYEVQGYPTLKFFPAGSSQPENYEGAREVDALVEFINSKVGTQRNADGSLKATAGRVAALDSVLAEATLQVTESVIETMKKVVDTLEGKAVSHGKLYVSTAEKIISKGADYLEKESQRLSKMVKSSNLKPEARANFQLKQNILAAFTAASSDEL
jgi:protein disulfide-isomerase A6